MGEDRTPPVRRTTVAEAASILGISAEAVRGRIRRGTLPVEREGGTVYVLLAEGTTDQPRTTTDQPTDRTDLLIAELQDRIRALEEANRENRRIIAALTSRIPELPPAASQEPPGGAAEAAEEPSARRPPQSVWESLREETERAEPRSTTQGAQEGPERPWWRRVFGG